MVIYLNSGESDRKIAFFLLLCKFSLHWIDVLLLHEFDSDLKDEATVDVKQLTAAPIPHLAHARGSQFYVSSMVFGFSLVLLRYLYIPQASSCLALLPGQKTVLKKNGLQMTGSAIRRRWLRRKQEEHVLLLTTTHE